VVKIPAIGGYELKESANTSNSLIVLVQGGAFADIRREEWWSLLVKVSQIIKSYLTGTGQNLKVYRHRLMKDLINCSSHERVKQLVSLGYL
jgi:hypothetical protein